MIRIPRHVSIDGFLPPDLHARLLSHTLSIETRFAPAIVAEQDRQAYDPDSRVAWYCADGLGPLKQAFSGAVKAILPDLFAGVGMEPFDVAWFELELAAHREGSFFRRHIDTMTQKERANSATDRVVTLVYYFHAEPRRFTGGELLLHPFGPAEPVAFEPRDNRLIAFPSIAMHEVSRVSAPEPFAAARFAVNCWLHRARPA